MPDLCVRLFSPALALMLLLGAAAPSSAESACRSGDITQTTDTLDGTPYLLTTVPGAERTIVLLHGGPEMDSLQCGDPLDLWLAERYRARVVKPHYYGSKGRSPWDQPLSLNLDADPMKGDQSVLAQIVGPRAGMQRSVEEARNFIHKFDGPDTVVIGESHGARIAVLATREPMQGRVVLFAPTLPSVADFFEATLQGTYSPPTPPEPVGLVIEGVDRTNDIFKTADERRQLLRAVSLAYYHPYEDVRLAEAITASRQPFHLIVGGKDRVAMITGSEWMTLRGHPQVSTLCVDETMGHEGPFPFEQAMACMDTVMRLSESSDGAKANAGKLVSRPGS
jgi:pimeloyl-ACP methyl ester carboxylesterase